MKRILTLGCLLGSALVQVNAAEPSAPEDQQMLAAIREIQTQQTAIAENQAKIEEKLAAVAEAIRVARIYSSRSGN